MRADQQRGDGLYVKKPAASATKLSPGSGDKLKESELTVRPEIGLWCRLPNHRYQNLVAKSAGEKNLN